jgi:hypothetical protein
MGVLHPEVLSESGGTEWRRHRAPRPRAAAQLTTHRQGLDEMCPSKRPQRLDLRRQLSAGEADLQYLSWPKNTFDL